jgi:hypothetical protein
MPDEPFALSTRPPEAPVEAEYEGIRTALVATARGRWFLQEYARRNRVTDIKSALSAIERIESAIQSEPAQQPHQHRPPQHPDMGPGSGVPEILTAVQRLQEAARSLRERSIELSTAEQVEQLAAAILSVTSLHNPGDRRAPKLAEMLGHLERRIAAMLDTSTTGSVPSADTGSQPEPPRIAAPLPADFLLDPLTAVSASTTPAPSAPSDATASRAPVSRGMAALHATSDEERVALFT